MTVSPDYAGGIVEDLAGTTMPGDLKVMQVAAPLRQRVVDTMREAIISGRFRPGGRLVER